MLDKDELSVSEPSGKATGITVTLSGERKISALDEKMSYSYEDGNTVIRIDITGANGKPFTLKF